MVSELVALSIPSPTTRKEPSTMNRRIFIRKDK